MPSIQEVRAALSPLSTKAAREAEVAEAQRALDAQRFKQDKNRVNKMRRELESAQKSGDPKLASQLNKALWIERQRANKEKEGFIREAALSLKIPFDFAASNRQDEIKLLQLKIHLLEQELSSSNLEKSSLHKKREELEKNNSDLKNQKEIGCFEAARQAREIKQLRAGIVRAKGAEIPSTQYTAALIYETLSSLGYNPSRRSVYHWYKEFCTKKKTEINNTETLQCFIAWCKKKKKLGRESLKRT